MANPVPGAPGPGRSISAYARNVTAREMLARHGAALLRDRVIPAEEFDGAELGMAYLTEVTPRLLSWMEHRG